MKKGLKIAIIIVAALLVAVVVTGGVLFEHFYGRMNYETVDLSNTDYTPDSDWDIDPDERGDETYPDYNETEPPATSADETSGEDSSAPADVTTTDVTTEEITTAEITTEEITTALITTEATVDFGDIPNIPMGKDVMNILVIGTDALTATAKGRSDAMIIVSINPEKDRIVLTSIMRDTYAYNPDSKTSNKINAAHAYGGAATLIKTIQENFGIHIDKYCRAKYADFVKVFEYVGGLDMTLTLEEIRYVNDGLKYDPNLQNIYASCKEEKFDLTVTDSIPESSADQLIHLNADALFIYARARKLSGGDYKRTERQRDVLVTAFNKVKSMSPAQMVSLLDKCLPFITTDMTRTDCLTFIWNAPTYAKYEIQSTRLPMDKYFVDTYATSGGKTSYLEIIASKKDEMMQKWASIVND